MIPMRRTLFHFPLVLAAAALLLVSGCSKPTPEEKLDEAIALFQQGNVARGVLRLQDIVREHGDDPIANDARLALARYYAQDGNAARAMENLGAVYERTTVGDPRRVEAFRGLVEINRQMGDFAEVKALFDSYMNSLPEGTMDRIFVQIERAEFLMNIARLGEEPDEETFEEGRSILHTMMLEHEEANVRGHARNVLANYHSSRGRYAEANAVFQEYLDAFPDDSIRNDIELVMAINVWASGEREEGLAMFEAVADQYLLELEDELERNIRNSRLMDLATMYVRIEQYDSARRILEQVMDENVHSEIAIRAQFQIAGLYVEPAFRNADREMLDKSITLLEQMARENPGSSIEDTARRAIQDMNTAFAQMVEAKEAWEAEQEAASAATAEDEPTETEEAPVQE